MASYHRHDTLAAERMSLAMILELRELLHCGIYIFMYRYDALLDRVGGNANVLPSCKVPTFVAAVTRLLYCCYSVFW